MPIHVSDWLIRAAVPEDEACIASMWLRQLCAGQDAKAAGLKGASVAGSTEQVAYWSEMQPIVTALIRGATVRVACDAERAEHSSDGAAVIWAWVVVDRECVYGAGIKRNAGSLAADIARDLLPELARPMLTVLDLVDLGRLKLIPTAWRRERGWASSLRQLSQRRTANDASYTRVAAHILDPARVPWVPNEQRRVA